MRVPPNAPSPPRAIDHATCGPVHASMTTFVTSSTLPLAISPAFVSKTLTVQQPPCAPRPHFVESDSKDAEVDRRFARIAVEPVGDLVVRDEDRGRLLLGQALLRLRERRRRARVRDEREPGDRDERPPRSASVPSPKRPELVADEVRRRHEHDRDRLRDDLAEPELDEHGQDHAGSRRTRAARRRRSAGPGRRSARARAGTSRAGSRGSCS